MPSIPNLLRSDAWAADTSLSTQLTALGEGDRHPSGY